MELRCQYASTFCPNTRSLKISGDYHRLCLFHRRSANAAQRRWKQKKIAATRGTHPNPDEAPTEPTTKPRTRRRQLRHTFVGLVKQAKAVSLESVAPPVNQVAQHASATQLQPLAFPDLPINLDIVTLPPLFVDDEMDFLSELVAGADGLPPTPLDCWWSEESYHQDIGLIT